MEQVRKWFLENRRSFPWREGVSAYLVLVSEVMLQQTRASVVIDYFNRWMKRFPTIEMLSQATESEVIKLWEGLGYYSRARNLLEIAKEIVSQYDGRIPDTLAELLRLKGIGDYTAGAILAFGFHKKSVALDGNVTRVVSRLVAFEKDAKKHANELRQIVYDLLPDREPHIVMEGLIELGATICAKNPLCNLCPLKENCIAYKKGIATTFPILPQRKPITELFRLVGCISFQNEYLVKQGEKGKIMASLFEFPYIDCEKDLILSCSQKKLEQLLEIQLKLIAPLQREKHHFTRYRAHLFPFHFEVSSKREILGYRWVKKNLLNTLPFSSGHKKVLTQL